jgi:DNA topoisomerase-1
MAAKKLVIVESPTKARTIKKFLSKDYIVESCMGHIRDLPKSAKDIPEKYKKEKWARIGVNVENNFEPIYLVPKTKTKVVTQLKKLLKEADELYLATDEDREGESISWHLLEVLKPKVPVKRMVFHEITKSAIQHALEDCRDINTDMVRAQEARRILDRLVGFTISPLLWKKVAYGLSAGRVQSVAVKLIAEKEQERVSFVKSHYSSISGKAEKDKTEFETRLTEWKGKRIASGKDFDEKNGKLKDDKKDLIHLNEKTADEVLLALKGHSLKVVSVDEKPVSRKPAPPFITSTLQQEANRKLGLSSREAMQVAQKLYEQGFITYMRTDSTFLSTQAIKAARDCIKDLYGDKYLPKDPRDYTKKKSKGAQEAHEAIRPAGSSFVKPEDTNLKGPQFALYDLIWKRTVASQMVNAEQKQMSVKLEAGEGLFTSNGLSLVFPGFFKAYVEGFDDPEQALNNREVHLPQLKTGDMAKVIELNSNQHETKPPARYTEASLVQKLEKEGVGRPSTYASIIGTIQDRGYVNKVGNSLQPTFTALIVTKLLEKHLSDYVDLNFTSEMENSLDQIAEGEKDWTQYLKSVYLGDKGLKSEVEKKEEKINPEESRAIRLKNLDDMTFKVGRYGAYVCKEHNGEEVCASLPEDRAPADVEESYVDKIIDQKINGTDALGKDPETGLPVYVLTGRYGPYVQLGESDGGEKEKPKRSSIPPTMEPDNLTLDQALSLLSLPKVLGKHPDTDVEIKAGLGRFGPFVVYEKDFRSIPKDMDLFTITLKQALELLARPKKGRGRAAPIKVLGDHPKVEEEMAVYNGKYGPYIKCGKVNVSVPEGQKPEDVTKEQAIELLAERIDEVSSKKTTKKATKKASAKKKTAKKKTSKKKATKKKSTKKKK